MKTLSKIFIGIVILIIVYTIATESGPLFTEKKSIAIGTIEISHTTHVTFEERLQTLKDNVVNILEND